MMYPKPQRTRSKKWTDLTKSLACLVQGRMCFGPVDPAHIRSRGSGGPDEEFNLVPLCRRHHSIQHKIGWFQMMDIYPQVKEALLRRGWEIGQRLYHEKLRRGDVQA